MKKLDKKIIGRYKIMCPICRKRLIDYREGIEAYVSPVSEEGDADFFTKCKSCGNEIGIRKIS